ncbi:hypothetical protein [Paenibacillus sp. NEAU-GSW1]|uniref:hypothetical protein n=1 Tax=Paenibacillus sp. NEAU-GSW1 TaxID=2682486 RepID=UPI0012E1AC83|nr:hypothetical protein [Paenibacillus sp. NEAU-GSW1]MUT66020.1 hypothetical protein [Paenibacillus sp. NEAU-GSW1]
MIEVVIMALLFIITILLVDRHFVQQRMGDAVKGAYEDMRSQQELWIQERSELLDRIQSTSFQEFKTQQVRTIKAQNKEPEQPAVQLL